MKALYCFILMLFACSDPVSVTSSKMTRPESVAYYEEAGIYFISDVGAGKIWKMGADGIIKEFTNGLNAPKGIVIYKSKLWVSDQPNLAEIDLKTGKVLNTYLMPGSKFLNDIDFDKDGYLYISDSDMNRIYKFNTNTRSLEDMNLTDILSPNGVLYDEERDRLLVVFRADNSPVKSIDLKTNVVTTLLNTNYSRLDGLQFNDNGNKLYFSSWASQAIIECEVREDGSLGEAKIFKDNLESPADFQFVKKKNVLAVPQMLPAKVIFINVPENN